MTDWAALLDALRAAIGGDDRPPPAVVHVAIDQELALLDLLGWDELAHVRGVVERRLRAVLGDRVVLPMGDAAWTAVVAPGPPTAAALRSLGSLVQRSLSGLVACAESEVFVSVTVCASPAAGTDPERALIAARIGCRDAQNAGGNRAVIADRFDTDAGYDADLTAALARAIDGRQIQAHYQPVVDLATGHVVGVEALARWQLEDGTAVSPAEFVASAERSGLVGALDAVLLDRVAAEFPALCAALGPGFALAVNVSPLRLVERQLLADMQRLAGEAAEHRATLVAEITESALLTDPLTTRAVLDRLGASGVHIALDDFGTGVSSLGHLRDFPVDVVKVDRSFVEGVGTDPVTEGLVSAVVAAGRALDCTVVAEGVETAEQASRLAALGAHLGQGYLWAPATAIDALAVTLEQIESARHQDRRTLEGRVSA